MSTPVFRYLYNAKLRNSFIRRVRTLAVWREWLCCRASCVHSRLKMPLSAFKKTAFGGVKGRLSWFKRPSFAPLNAVFCVAVGGRWLSRWLQVADCQGVMWNVVKSVKIGGLQSVARCLALRARPGSVKRIIRKVRVSLPCAVFPTLCHICHDAVRSQIFHFSLPVIH